MAYRRFSERFWLKYHIRRLGDDSKLLYFYLLTCPHNNPLTCYWLPVRYAASELGWSDERVREQFEDGSSGLVAWDAENNLIAVKGLLEKESLANPDSVAAALKWLEALPHTSVVYITILDRLEWLGQRFAERLQERLPKRYSVPSESKGVYKLLGVSEHKWKKILRI